jgi:hypothetical protein
MLLLLLLLLLGPELLLALIFFLRWLGLVAWKRCQKSAVWRKSVHTLLLLLRLRLRIRRGHVIRGHRPGRVGLGPCLSLALPLIVISGLRR